MSSDEYALALAQKYRLAISMAVLKTKPENLTINEYINEIRDVIIDRNKDTSQQDFDMTACSEDFNIADDDDDEIMMLDFSHDFNDQDVKSVSNDPRNDRDNRNQNELQENKRQIDNDYKNDDKLTHDSQVNDKAVRINLTEEIESIVIGTQDYCRKRQTNDNTTPYDGNSHQSIGINQNDGNIIRSYEKCDKIGIRCKVNSKGIEISGDKERAMDMTQDNKRFQENTYRSQEYENKTQMTDTNIGETESHDPNKERKDKFREVIRILKGVDVSIEKVVKEQLITTPGIIKSFDPSDLDLTQCYDNTNDSFLPVDRLAHADCESNVQDYVKNKQNNNYNTMEVCNSVATRIPNEIINLAPKDRQEVRKRKTDFHAQKNTNTDAKLHKITKTDNIETVKFNPRNSSGNNTQYYAMESNHKQANNIAQNEVDFAPKTTILDYESINHMEVSNNIAIQEDIYPVGVINTQDTQFNTHYSESQMYDIVIDKNLIYGNRNQNFGINDDINKLVDGNTNQENTEDRTISIYTHKIKDLKSQKVTNNATENEFALTECQNAFPSQGFYTRTNNCTENGIALSFDMNDRINIEQNTEFESLQNDRKTVKDLHKNKTNFPSQGFYTRTNDCTENGIASLLDTNDIVNIENNTEFTIDIRHNDRKHFQDLHSDKNKVANTQTYQINTERDNLIENNTAFLQTQDMNLTQISTQVYEDNKKTNNNNEIDTVEAENENDCTDFNKSIDIDDAETTEKVPFKILEEINQIKSYLSKKREFKDSGYKSSQSQRSGIGTQPSSVRVGESADSVFIYLSSCPLDVATQELIEQISEVLGQVIDRLHEEQIYPKFLEELLNTIEKLLHLVYEEENYDFDMLQKKDERIQRIILLNKSSHINKFTIEKINKILQKLINEISDTDYEIQEINQLENLCYIFHILQIILPKYIQGSLYNSQASQSSQEQKVLKKQDISDIWRRKWFTYTEDVENKGSLEIKCVLKECSALLNKIIVDFMDGYSLIAFSALKCFNLIQ